MQKTKIKLNGKTFEINDVANDMRLVTAVAITQDENATEESRLAAFSRIFSLYFGDAAKALEVEDAWAAEHDGVCDAAEFISWLMNEVTPKK
jgi:hypothetical protein